MYLKATNMYEGEENLPHMKKLSNYRYEKHLFWDADYVCSEYRGRTTVFAVPNMNAFYDKVLLCGITIRIACGEVVGGVNEKENNEVGGRRWRA